METTPYFAQTLSTSNTYGAEARGSTFEDDLGLYTGDDVNHLSQDTKYIPAQNLENYSSRAFHHSPTAFNRGLDRTNYISQPHDFRSPRMARGSRTNVGYRAGEVALNTHGPNNVSTAGAEVFSKFLNQANTTWAAGPSTYSLGNTRASGTNHISSEVPHPSTGPANIWATQMPKPEALDLVPLNIDTGTRNPSQTTTGAFDHGAHGALVHNNNNLFNADLYTRIANAKERNARSRNARVQIAKAHLSSARHARANANDVPATVFNVTAACDTGYPRTPHLPRATQSHLLPHSPLESNNNPIVLSPEQDTTDNFLAADQHDASGWKFDIFEDPPTGVTAPPNQDFFDTFKDPSTEVTSPPSRGFFDMFDRPPTELMAHPTQSFSNIYEGSPAEAATTSTDGCFDHLTDNGFSGALSISTTLAAPADESLTYQTRERPTANHESPSALSFSDALLWVPEGKMPPTGIIVTASAPTTENIIRDTQEYLPSNTYSQALPDPANKLAWDRGVSEHPKPASTPPASKGSVNHVQTQPNLNHLQAAYPASSNDLGGIQNTLHFPASNVTSPSTSETQVNRPQELQFPGNPIRDFYDLLSDDTTNIYGEKSTATISPPPNRHPATLDRSLAPTVPDQPMTVFHDHLSNDPPLFDRALPTHSSPTEPTVDFYSFFRTDEDEDADALWFGNITLPP